MEWLTSTEVSKRTHRHIDTVRRASALGELHGHQSTRKGKSVRGSRWSFASTAVDAWVQGHDVDAQRRACGCPALVGPPSRARRAG